MPAPVTVDLSGSLGYAGDPPVGVDLTATAYEGDPPYSVTPAASASAPQIGILDGGSPSSTYEPAAVIDAGSL